MAPKLTIGELSRRTGLSVKKIRFYSDEGLLPPAARSASGYRLYSEQHVLRIDLIRALREAGVGLADIGKVLRRDLALEDVLALRLEEVEAHIAGLERVAGALRVAIRSGAPEQHLRRISMTVRASNEERRAVIAAFYNRVVDGLPAPREWTEGMIDASAPSLPEPPSPEQVAAWIELESFLGDASFMASRRVNAADFWAPIFDKDVFLDAHLATMGAVAEARTRGVAPASAEGMAIVEGFVAAMAARTAGKDASTIREHLRTKFDPRGARYWELVSILRDEVPRQRYDDWRWLGEALQRAPGVS